MNSEEFLTIIYDGLQKDDFNKAAGGSVHIEKSGGNGDIALQLPDGTRSLITRGMLTAIHCELSQGCLSVAQARTILGRQCEKNMSVVEQILGKFALARRESGGDCWKPLWKIDAEVSIVSRQSPFESIPRALLDCRGNIVRVNGAWKRFARTNNGSKEIETGVGLNYLNACKMSNSNSRDSDHLAYDGIKSVLEKKRNTFKLRYTCNSPKENRWHLLYVTQFTDKFVSVTHFPLKH